jgi:serine/threonine protein phosphatase 1
MIGNTYTIGDIHGALKALTQLIKRIKPKNSDKLIFIGDYVDGWSESAQVIDFLIELDKKFDCIFIKGNHDAWCEEWLDTGATNDLWLKHGGIATIESYKDINTERKKLHLDFFRKMKLYVVDEQNRLFIHAGYTSMFGPERETHFSNLYWDRTLWEMALSADSLIAMDSLRYPKRLKLYQEIFIGHTPTIQFGSDVPIHGMNVWNVDTGAAFTGKLSALNIDTKEFWQSDTCQSLYPNEKGRNK